MTYEQFARKVDSVHERYLFEPNSVEARNKFLRDLRAEIGPDLTTYWSLPGFSQVTVCWQNYHHRIAWATVDEADQRPFEFAGEDEDPDAGDGWLPNQFRPEENPFDAGQTHFESGGDNWKPDGWKPDEDETDDPDWWKK